jgi:hypothetical protein
MPLGYWHETPSANSSRSPCSADTTVALMSGSVAKNPNRREQPDASLQSVLTAIPVRDQRLDIEDDCMCRKLLERLNTASSPAALNLPAARLSDSTSSMWPRMPLFRW